MCKWRSIMLQGHFPYREVALYICYDVYLPTNISVLAIQWCECFSRTQISIITHVFEPSYNISKTHTLNYHYWLNLQI